MANQTQTEASWAPITRRRSIPEVETTWVAEHFGEARVIDVRELDELTGSLGHIPGVEHVPLGQLDEVARGWDRDQKIVLVCRSAGRSGRAATALERLGFTRVASMAGGMLEWNEEDLPTTDRL